MLHWKSKLAYLLVAATVLAAFLGEPRAGTGKSRP